MNIKSSRVCTIDSPCKINLHLKIGERRADGFHSLESLFTSLAFGDTLRFECTEKEGECSLSMNWEIPGEPILPEENLVFRAVSLFREQSGFKNGLRINLDKRIPVGAGLGGGSSNAASSLLALNILAGSPLSMEKLSKMAAVLGSDVPFFLKGGLAFVGGRGELVDFFDFSRKIWVVLGMPPVSIATANAYRLLDQARKGGIGENNGQVLSKMDLLQALNKDPSSWPFQNDFLSLFLNSKVLKGGENELNSGIFTGILEALRKEGASFTGLSGSGSCCYGIFTTREAAERAERELSGKQWYLPGGKGTENLLPHQANFVKMTFFLARRVDPVVK